MRTLSNLERISDFLMPEVVETQLAALDLIEEASPSPPRN